MKPILCPFRVAFEARIEFCLMYCLCSTANINSDPVGLRMNRVDTLRVPSKWQELRILYEPDVTPEIPADGTLDFNAKSKAFNPHRSWTGKF